MVTKSLHIGAKNCEKLIRLETLYNGLVEVAQELQNRANSLAGEYQNILQFIGVPVKMTVRTKTEEGIIEWEEEDAPVLSPLPDKEVPKNDFPRLAVRDNGKGD